MRDRTNSAERSLWVQMSTWGTTTAAPAPRAGTVEVLVGLLAELDEATESGVFYDRVCQAVVTLTSMKRAVLLLHDETYRSVIPVGAQRRSTRS